MTNSRNDIIHNKKVLAKKEKKKTNIYNKIYIQRHAQKRDKRGIKENEKYAMRKENLFSQIFTPRRRIYKLYNYDFHFSSFIELLLLLLLLLLFFFLIFFVFGKLLSFLNFIRLF